MDDSGKNESDGSGGKRVNICFLIIKNLSDISSH